MITDPPYSSGGFSRDDKSKELARLKSMHNADAHTGDGRDWARSLLARHQVGMHRATPTTLAMALNALRPLGKPVTGEPVTDDALRQAA